MRDPTCPQHLDRRFPLRRARTGAEQRWRRACARVSGAHSNSTRPALWSPMEKSAKTTGLGMPPSLDAVNVKTEHRSHPPH
jgi:hypothetical protein